MLYERAEYLTQMTPTDSQEELPPTTYIVKIIF